MEWISNFFHIFSIINMCTWIKPFIFNMLKLLFTNCILHSLEYIKTHAIQCFVIIFEWLMSFFTFFKLSSLHELNHPIWIYWNHYSNVTYCTYYYILKHITQFNASHLCLNTLMNFFTFAHELNNSLEHVNSITYKLHFAFIIMFWNGYIKIRQVSHLYLNG